jgi:hypothetical protein
MKYAHVIRKKTGIDDTNCIPKLCCSGCHIYWQEYVISVIISGKPQETLNLLVTEKRYWPLFYMPLVTEECHWALFYMPLYVFLHNLLNVLVQNGITKKIISGWSLYVRSLVGNNESTYTYIGFFLLSLESRNRLTKVKSRQLTRLHVHTLAYQAIFAVKNSPWKHSKAAAAKASLTANRHVCGSKEVGVVRNVSGNLNNSYILWAAG